MKGTEFLQKKVKSPEELKNYQVIKLPENEGYDFITSMATQVCNAKISLVNMITDNHQWFFSYQGLEISQIEKVHAFCSQVISNPNNPLIVEDARKDERFRNQPLTIGGSPIIFYISIPLVTSNGSQLGRLCVIDDKPKQLDQSQLEQLKKLADHAVTLFELRKKTIELDSLNNELDKKNEFLLDTQQANKLGSWEMDIASGKTTYTDIVYEIHEVPKNFNHNEVNLIKFYHPESKAIINKAITKCMHENVPFNLVCKMITAKDKSRWVRIMGRKVDHKIIGSLQDITNIKHNEIRFKSIIEGTNVGTWEWNVQTGETIFNERWAQIVGYTLEELAPISIDTWLKLAHPEDLAESNRRLNACFNKKTTFYEFETRMKHKAGHWVWAYDKGKVFEWTKDGKPLMMYGTHQEITERKQSEGMLTKLSSKFAHLTGRPFFNSVCRDASEISGLDFVFVGELNPDGLSVSTLGGYAKGEPMEPLTYDLEHTPCENVIGKESCIYPKDIQQAFPLDHLLKEMGIESYFGFPLFSKENQPVGLMVGMHCSVLDDAKKIETLFSTYSDRVSAEMQRTKSEEVRKELLKRFEHIGNNIPGAIYQYRLMPDGTSCFPYASSGIKNIYGVTPEQVKQDATLAFKMIHPDDLEQVIDSINKSAESMTQWRNTFRVELPSKETIWVEGKSSPQLQEDGSILWHGFIQNITERKKAEDELLYNQNLLKALYNLLPIGIALNDYETGRFLNVNDKLLEPTGYSKEEFLSLNYWDTTPEAYKPYETVAIRQMERKGSFDLFENEYIRKDGSRYPIALEGVVIHDNYGKKLIWSVVRDISREKESERALQEAISKLQAILDASKHFTIVATDEKGIINLFNSGAELHLGYKPHEVIGKCNPGIFHLPDEVELESQKLSKKYNKDIKGFETFAYEAKIGKPTTKEWTHVGKDGTNIPVLLSVNTIKVQDEIVGYLGVAADISELKKVEMEIRSLLDVTKDQNDRLKNFTQIVSHNLRSHSSGISELLKLIDIELPEISKHELIKYLKNGVENLNQTVNDLNEIIKVNFSQNEASQIGIHAVLQKNLDSLNLQIKKADIEIINNVDKDLVVKAVPAYLDSIALNMITNAIKYRSTERKSYLIINATVEKSMVTISFEDNGQGIDMKRHGDQLFGMYKTFHNHDDSKGVGLFITKNQINSMRGKIKAESKVNVGTTFKITLPI